MRFARSLPALLIAVGLAGCASGPTGSVTAQNNPSLYSVHQPVVQRTDYVLQLDASGDTLSPAERARLAAWFDSIELRYGDRLYVEEPRDYPSPGARAQVVAGSTGPGTVRVITSRATASVPGCPDWGTPKIAPTVGTSPNYGCATNSNLAAMIADPNDLVLGQQDTGAGNAATANRAVRVYRNRQPTGTGPLAAPSTTGRGN
jgi:pilus assembly protein CpaD